MKSPSPRPRQARYQAALRPDMKCWIDSKALSNIIATPVLYFEPRLCTDCARMRLLHRDCAHCNRHQSISRRCHFVGSTVEFFQGLALHRQFHFGILLEDLLARSGRQANWICRRNAYPARPSLQGHCPNAEEDLRFTQLLTVPFTWRRRDYIGSPSNSPAQACPNKRKAELS